MVSTVSKKLKSLFGTYTIYVDESNYSQISEVLSNAVKRSFGPEVRLDLKLDTYSVYPTQIKEILTSFKENLVSLRISLNRDDPEILLEPHLEFTNIKRLDILFCCVDEGLDKNMCEAILARYGDKLEHLGIMDLKIQKNTVLQVAHLSKLKSLTLDTVGNNIVNTFVNAVIKENITYLSLCNIRLDIDQLDNLIFPNLQHLESSGSGTSVEPALALIKCHKNTITQLKVDNVNFTNSDIEGIKIPNLSNLELLYVPGDVALSLIKCNKGTITKLNLFNFRNSDIGDIKIPNLQYLKLLCIPGDVALSLIKCNKDTLCEIRLRIFDFRKPSLPVVEMPRLNRLYLCCGDATTEIKVFKFIKAFGGNIEEFWSFDAEKLTYIRKSREELNNLKTEVLALQTNLNMAKKMKIFFNNLTKNLKNYFLLRKTKRLH